jgi:hypothetical protein
MLTLTDPVLWHACGTTQMTQPPLQDRLTRWLGSLPLTTTTTDPSLYVRRSTNPCWSWLDTYFDQYTLP